MKPLQQDVASGPKQTDIQSSPKHSVTSIWNHSIHLLLRSGGRKWRRRSRRIKIKGPRRRMSADDWVQNHYDTKNMSNHADMGLFIIVIMINTDQKQGRRAAEVSIRWSSSWKPPEAATRQLITSVKVNVAFILDSKLQGFKWAATNQSTQGFLKVADQTDLEGGGELLQLGAAAVKVVERTLNFLRKINEKFF